MRSKASVATVSNPSDHDSTCLDNAGTGAGALHRRLRFDEICKKVHGDNTDIVIDWDINDICLGDLRYQ